MSGIAFRTVAVREKWIFDIFEISDKCPESLFGQFLSAKNGFLSIFDISDKCPKSIFRTGVGRDKIRFRACRKFRTNVQNGFRKCLKWFPETFGWQNPEAESVYSGISESS